jgi:peptidoglycan/xylan/chitin deacetylase (PgdA/CDA1 family)
MGTGLHGLFGDRSGNRFGILMYHRVAERSSGVAAPTWNVTPVRLRSQIEGLLSHAFKAWPLRTILETVSGSRSLPPKVFAVTFDDGFENNLLDALPVLADLRVPATIFVATAYLDSARPFPCDDWPAAGSPCVPAKSWRPLSTSQCHALLESGWVDLGAHTHTHQDFCTRQDEFERDLAKNVEVLRSRFGLHNPPFAFPFGRATSRMMHIVRHQGLSCALTTAEVLVDPRTTPYGWARFNVESWDTAATLSAKLTGWCSWARKVRRTVAARRRPELVSG